MSCRCLLANTQILKISKLPTRYLAWLRDELALYGELKQAIDCALDGKEYIPVQHSYIMDPGEETKPYERR